MPYDARVHHRRSIRMPAYDYSQDGAYFVTVCTRDKRCLFGEVVDGEMRENGIGRIVRAVWDDLPRRFPNVALDAFVIMPNHVHAIIVLVGAGLALPSEPGRTAQEGGASPAPTRTGPPQRRPRLGDVVGGFKSISAVRANKTFGTTGPLWQRNYYEHVLRNEDDLARTREYIASNPAGWAHDGENPHSVPH